MRAEPHLVVVHREMRQAASQLEELLAWVAVALVLLHGVVHRLLGQAVLQLEGGDRQAVDEQAQVQGKLGLVAAVAQLPGDAEAVLPIEDLGSLVPRRRRAVEQVDLVRPALDPLAQHVDAAALGDLALQAGQESAPRRAVLAQAQRFRDLGLRGAEECRKLRQVDAVLPVIVLRSRRRSSPPRSLTAARAPRPPPADRRAARQRRADEALEPSLAGVGGRSNRPAHVLSPGSIERASSYVRPVQNLGDVCRVDLVIGELLQRRYLRSLPRRQLRHVLLHKTSFHVVSLGGR